MEYLDEQEDFERMIGRGPVDDGVVAANASLEKEPAKKISTSGSTIIYFGATWCGPCKRVAPKALELMAQNPKIRWLKCDVDRNNYTPNYCNVKGIPAFLAIQDMKIVGQAQISDPVQLAQWVDQIFPK